MKKRVGVMLITLSIFLSLGAVIPAQAAGLTDAQMQAILSLLSSFGADSTTISSVNAALHGQATGGPSSAGCLTLTYNLYAGMTDSQSSGQVSQLQQFLGVSSATGYFGPQTQQAVQDYQSSHGIVSSGSPDTTGYGFVGPATRAAMACPGSTSTNTSTSNTNTAPTANTTQVAPEISSPVSPAASGATTINVTYPQSGFTLVNSNTAKSNTQIATIQWSEQNGNYPVNIWLLNSSGQILKLLANNIPNTGSYVWAYDPSLQSGTYEIEIDVAYTAGSAGGQSRAYSGFFTVQTILPSVTVTYPNGGEQISYNTGKDVDFNATWAAANYAGTVSVFLSSASGSLCLLGSALASQGTLPVTIGANFTCQNGQPAPVSGGQYKLYVAGTDQSGKDIGDYSDGYFTLTSAK